MFTSTLTGPSKSNINIYKLESDLIREVVFHFGLRRRDRDSSDVQDMCKIWKETLADDGANSLPKRKINMSNRTIICKGRPPSHKLVQKHHIKTHFVPHTPYFINQVIRWCASWLVYFSLQVWNHWLWLRFSNGFWRNVRMLSPQRVGQLATGQLAPLLEKSSS